MLACCRSRSIRAALRSSSLLYSSGSGSSVEEECMAALPGVVNDVLTQYDHTPVARQWFSQVLHHHLPFQPINMGFAVVESYRELVPDCQDQTLAHVVAWCVEMLGAFLVVVDDMYDGATDRYGRPCWYREHELGPAAVNDALFLHTSVFSLLRRHAGRRPCYPALLQLFHQAGHSTHMGQVLDLRSVGDDGRPRWQLFTDDYQRTVSRYKAEYYVACLPVTAALHLAGCEDEQLLGEARHVLGLLGRLFQAQDDYLDVFGDPAETGKSGNDIREGRCNWVMVRALQTASPSQRARLMENYGRADPDSVSAVKQVYYELNIPQIFTTFEDKLHRDIVARIHSSRGSTRPLFLRQLAKLYRRQLPGSPLLQHSPLTTAVAN